MQESAKRTRINFFLFVSGRKNRKDNEIKFRRLFKVSLRRLFFKKELIDLLMRNINCNYLFLAVCRRSRTVIQCMPMSALIAVPKITNRGRRKKEFHNPKFFGIKIGNRLQRLPCFTEYVNFFYIVFQKKQKDTKLFFTTQKKIITNNIKKQAFLWFYTVFFTLTELFA